MIGRQTLAKQLLCLNRQQRAFSGVLINGPTPQHPNCIKRVRKTLQRKLETKRLIKNLAKFTYSVFKHFYWSLIKIKAIAHKMPVVNESFDIDRNENKQNYLCPKCKCSTLHVLK